MAYPVIISSYAHQDEDDAYTWYEKQRTGLGDELLTELDGAYQKLSENPEHYGFIDDRKELRDFRLKRFPFFIVYRINQLTIEVIAVHHAKKHPSKKYGADD